MAKIIPIDVIKGISGKYGNKSSDYFATNRSSNQIHLAKIVNPYQGPPTEKQKAQQAKFAARQVVSTAWLNANRPSETTGEKGTADYQLVQRMKRQMGLSNINQVLHKYMGEDNVIRLPHGDEFQAPPTQDGGGSSAGDTKRRHTITLTSANLDQGTVSGGGTYDEGAHATIRATPKTSFAFDKWSDGNTQSVRTLTVNADLSLTPPSSRPARAEAPTRAEIPTRVVIPTKAAAEPSATNPPSPGPTASRKLARGNPLLPLRAAITTIHHFINDSKKHSLSCQQTRKRPGSLSSRRPSPSSRPSPPAWASRVASQPSERPTLPTRVNHPKRLNRPTAARLATRSSLPARPNRYRAGPSSPP